jgi:hypothetical protein
MDGKTVFVLEPDNGARISSPILPADITDSVDKKKGNPRNLRNPPLNCSP